MRLSFFILILIIAKVLEGQPTLPGADRSDIYLSKLKGKKIAITCNHTSMVGSQHLVDFLIANRIEVVKIFAPEHGFRGEADAGAKVKSEFDKKTNISIKSLYGKNLKPSKEDLKGVDIMLFDIQDVGVRFYTYISTLQYVLEACADANIPIIVFDRPNPNGHYIDGPVLDKKVRSFVGMQSVPIVYGMTIGEYAKMLVGEKWLGTKKNPKLDVIPCLNYSHNSRVVLSIPPSPNLKSSQAIALYPSLCLFEGTDISVGRGTETPFELYGSSFLDKSIMQDSFLPVSRKGASSPPYMNQWCYGERLSSAKVANKCDLSYLLKAYKYWNKDKKEFFLPTLFFDNLAGNSALRLQIINGKSEQEIRASWNSDLEKFKRIRRKYLMYADF
jgi:uncharacterized protein YbbC (DUF1343 family)